MMRCGWDTQWGTTANNILTAVDVTRLKTIIQRFLIWPLRESVYGARMQWMKRLRLGSDGFCCMAWWRFILSNNLNKRTLGLAKIVINSLQFTLKWWNFICIHFIQSSFATKIDKIKYENPNKFKITITKHIYFK